jgi:predicted nuclease of predicted toxin-antitoxin system
MLRLLVELNLSPEWLLTLREAGHQASHWSEVGDPRALDSERMAWAIEHECAVLTHDLDFGTALARSGQTGPSAIQVRCFNVLPECIGSWVLDLLSRYEPSIRTGALIVANERRHRVRVLPLQR